MTSVSKTKHLSLSGLLMLAVLMGASPFLKSSAAEMAQAISTKSLKYKVYTVETGELIDHSLAIIKELPSGERHVDWRILDKSYQHIDEYVLSDQWETLQWKIYLSDRGTEYIGKKQGSKLILSGTAENKKLSKTIKLKKDLPFYYNPKISLKWFAQSEHERMEFWGFRSDKFSEYKMKAEKKGVEMFEINGEPVEAVKVYWAATGIGERFFNRVYYYRVSDGEFLGQDPSDGWTMKLIDTKSEG